MRTVEAGELLAVKGDGEFITAVYSQLFDRKPDIDGFLHYRFLLRAGLSREEVLSILAQSEERRANHVVLANLPPVKKRGLIGGLVFSAKVHLRWIAWRLLDRSGEVIETRDAPIDSSKSWDLSYQAATTLINRQQVLESQLYTWRREMEARGLKVEAALSRLSDKVTALQGGSAPKQDEEVFEGGVSPGLAFFLGRMLQPGMVIIDAGVGSGEFSALVAGAIHPGGMLYALEARPDESALPAALEKHGVCASGRCAVLPISCLAAVLEKEPKVDVLRLSVEGTIAKAAAEILWPGSSNGILRILWECRPAALAAQGLEVDGIIRALHSAGFRAMRICPTTGKLLPMPTDTWNESLVVWLERAAGEAQCN